MLDADSLKAELLLLIELLSEVNDCNKSILRKTLQRVSDLSLNALNSMRDEEKELAVKQEISRQRRKRNVCKFCRRQFANLDLLANHISSKHSQDNAEVKTSPSEENVTLFCCQECNFCTLDSFELHECLEGKKAQFMPSETLLRDHNRFICSKCGDEFRQLSRIRYHLTKCRGGPFACGLCDFEAASRRFLAEHKRDVHKDSTPFACDECPKRFKFNASLQKHLANRHENNSESFPCKICKKRFVKKVYLTNHVNRFHKAAFKEFLCQTCGERFSSHQSLKSHESIHSSDPKPFSCPKCPKSFRRKDKLEFHMAIHTGNRPHKCS